MIIYDNAPNLILNSWQEFAQRTGGSVNLTSSPTIQGMDNWFSWFSNTFTGTPTSNRSGLPVAGGPLHAVTTNEITSTPTNAASSVSTGHIIESYRTRGWPQSKFSFSFWAYVTNYQNCEISFFYPSVADNYATQTLITTINIPTNLGGWKQFKIEDIGLLSTNGLKLQITFNQPQTLSVASQVYATEYMLSPGSRCSYPKLHAGNLSEELRQLMRYYEKSYALNTAPGALTFEGAHGWGGIGVANRPSTTITYRETKRTNSNLGFYNPSTGSTITSIFDSNASVSYGHNVGAQGARSFTINPSGTPPNTAILYVHWFAAADIQWS